MSSASANTLTPFDSPTPAELDASSKEGVDGFAFSLEKGDHEVVLRCVLGQLFPHPRCADPLPGEGWEVYVGLFPHPRCADPLPGEGWDSLLTREGWEACDVFT